MAIESEGETNVPDPFPDEGTDEEIRGWYHKYIDPTIKKYIDHKERGTRKRFDVLEERIAKAESTIASLKATSTPLK